MNKEVQEKDQMKWVVVPPPQKKPYKTLKAHWDEQGWPIRPWGNGSMKSLPFSTEDFDYKEYDPSEVNIPQEGLQRLEVAYEMVRIRRVIIADEKHPVIDVPPEPEIWKPDIPKPDFGKIKEMDLYWVKPLAIGLGVIALVAAAIVALPAILFGAAVVAGATLDPGVLCELEDGTWAEVYYYFPQDSSGH